MTKYPNPTISIQGFLGSFHHIVANELWPGVKILERSTFPEVFADVSAEVLGIVAIENSIAGAILENYDRLKNSGLQVIAEKYLRIQHNLIALPGTKLEDIKEIWSHPMALKQCQKFLQKYPHIKTVEIDDTARSVKQIVAEKLTHVAGIASNLAAHIYGGEILVANVEDDPQNYTRFLVIATDRMTAAELGNEGKYKTSVYLETSHEPGALVSVLQVLQTFKLNMSMLVSRPVVGKPFSYGFYIDFEHENYDVPGLTQVLEQHTASLSFLGTYVADNLINT